MANPQPFTHGPGHIFPGVGPGKSPLYLGTATTTPRIELRPEVVAYFNSIYSPNVPMDWCDVGEQAYVFADVNRWNEADVLSKCQSRPNPGGQRGLHAAGDLGTVVIFEGFSYPLWIQFPYSTAKAAMSNAPAGYRFFNARLVGPDIIEPINMTPSSRRLIWHCLEAITAAPGNVTVSQLYDFNMTGLPQVA